jgi:hypothetical protein
VGEPRLLPPAAASRLLVMPSRSRRAAAPPRSSSARAAASRLLVMPSRSRRAAAPPRSSSARSSALLRAPLGWSVAFTRTCLIVRCTFLLVRDLPRSGFCAAVVVAAAVRAAAPHLRHTRQRRRQPRGRCISALRTHRRAPAARRILAGRIAQPFPQPARGRSPGARICSVDTMMVGCAFMAVSKAHQTATTPIIRFFKRFTY